MPFTYTDKFLNKFTEFFPRYTGYDLLTRVLASLDDYPYTSVVEYRELNSLYFKSLFTVDGKVGTIKYPNTSKMGKTKYILTRNPLPTENYKILCVCAQDGNITCRTGAVIHNPVVNEISFVVMVKQNFLEEIPLSSYSFQLDRAYNYNELKNKIIKLHAGRSLNLKDFMSMRHDMLQMYICQCYGLTYYQGTALDLKLYGVTSNQTPDFFEISEGQCLIGDITVTSNTTTGMVTKYNKYQKLIEQLVKSYKVIPFFISLHHSMLGFHTQLNNLMLPRLFIDNSFESDIGEFANIFEDLKHSYPLELTETLDLKYEMIDPVYTSYGNIKDSYTEVEDDDIMSIFNEEVLEAYKDDKFDVSDILSGFATLKDMNKDYVNKLKPSHYIPIPPDSGLLKVETGLFSEQKMLINFFTLNSIKDEVYGVFSKTITDNLSMYSQSSYKMFTEGKWFDDQDDLKKEYHKLKVKSSFEKFAIARGRILPGDGVDKIIYPKMVQLCLNTQNNISTFLKKSGQDYRKLHLERDRPPKTTCDLEESYLKVENFLNLLCKKTDKDWSENFFENTGQDVEFVTNLKNTYSKMATEDIKHLGTSYCYKYLRYNSLMYEQLIHYSNLSMNKKRFAMFNSGIPNICCIMRCGYRGMAQQIGKPFMFMGITSDLDFLKSGMFGDLYVESLPNNTFYFRTKWFRLPTFRLEFFRDQYYSILGSSMSSLARVRNLKWDIEQLKGTFCVRTIIGLMANQKGMEKLADSRYAIMSSFSTHTNFKELLTEKFAPPYKSYIEGWIVSRLLKELPTFRDSIYETKNIRINIPILDYLDRRYQQSTGGTFNVKAIWSDRKLFSLQDLLDELFLYVHTPKEPSTAFHEEINAMKTINKFQREFDKYSQLEKCGDHKDIQEWLLQKHPVGFSKTFLYKASQYYRQVGNFDLNKIEKDINLENFGDLTSTKAVVPDLTRKIRPIDKHMKYRINDTILRTGKLSDEQHEYIKKQEENNKDLKFRSSAELFFGREKVHDACLTYLTNYNEETVLKNALLYYNLNNAKVLTDICIKAQYGGKREFYVMNMGAKVMARVVENFYKAIANTSQTEMISVAGDRKLIHMQNMMDRTIKHALNQGNMVSYCNGDCTKWSASETMEAFHVLTDGLTFDWDSDFKRVLHNIIDSWTKKTIQVPQNLVSKVYPLGEKTDYLFEASKNNYEIPSTQNFLQGVFNYMSSVKADVCNKYTCYLWNKYHNDSSDFYVEYLVHSDDYVFAFSSPNIETIEKFRSFHKICMKLCGITDSSKKTNVQPVFMEFISLVCFNGSMSYPTIKKTKEIATTLPCESFSGDSDMVCSRTGECVRVGVDFYSSWLFHKIHMGLLRRAYSLHEGGFNYIKDRCNMPVQCFGESDMHPIFYFLSKGDPNNLRIFNYTSNKEILKKLYSLGDREDVLKTVQSSFLQPSFVYNNYTNRIVKIRKNTGLEPDMAMKYWENNLIYNFVKPKNIDDLKMWLKCMYFKSSFIKAYNRDNRTTRLLRLSAFSRNKCVTYKTDEELAEFYIKLSECKDKFEKQDMINSEMYTIKELQEYLSGLDSSLVDDRDIQIAILMGDSTPDLIYRWMENTTIEQTSKINTFNTCATFSPYKASWLGVSMPVDQVLMYAIDPKLFYLNYGVGSDINSLEIECNKVSNALPGLFDLIRNKNEDYKLRSKALQIAYNTYVNNLPSYQVCMSSKRHRQHTTDFLTDAFKYSHHPVYVCEVHSQVIHLDMNPYTLQRHSIIGRERSNSGLKQLLNVITLAYTYLLFRRNLTEDESAHVIKYTNFNFENKDNLVGDYLKLFTLQLAKNEGLTYSELIAFVFFKYLLNHDIDTLRTFLSNKIIYNYSYIKRQRYVKGKYEGDMNANFHIENVFGNVKLSKGELQIEVDSYNTAKGELSYLIGSKLSSNISESVFLRLCNKRNPLEICQTCKAWCEGLFLTWQDNRFLYKVYRKNESYFGLPVRFSKELINFNAFDKTENYLFSSNFTTKGISIMLENRKMFTLPFKSMNFVPINLSTDFKDICIYNELLAFEILGVNPKETYDIKLLCEQLPEPKPIEKQVLDVSSIQLVFDFFDPTLYNIEQAQDDLVDNFDVVDSAIEEFESKQEEDIEETQMSPFENLYSQIKLVDTYSPAVPTIENIYTLKNKGDIIENVIKYLLGMKETFFLTPHEYFCTTHTIVKLEKEKENRPWLYKLGLFLKKWVEKEVKSLKRQEVIGNYLLDYTKDDLVIYQIFSTTIKNFNLRKSQGSDAIVFEDISQMSEFEVINVYKPLSLEKYLIAQDNRFDPLPFYNKKDDFYHTLLDITIGSIVF